MSACFMGGEFAKWTSWGNAMVESSFDLNLQGVLKYEWNGYVKGIFHCGLNLTEEDDMLSSFWNEEPK